MTSSRDPDRLIHQFLLEGQEQLHDQVYDAVRASIEHQRQRVVIGPWRMPSMNKLVPMVLGAAVVVAIVVIGSRFLGPAPSSSVGGPPSAEPTAIPSPEAIGGNVTFQSDGAPAATKVEAVVDGGSVSGTAVTTFARGSGTHTVRLECAVRDGDTWAFGGTIEETTVLGERAGDWSAVIVQDGTPQRIALWLSDEKSAGTDCDGWLTSIELATVDPENFTPVESGELVPPPDPAP